MKKLMKIVLILLIVAAAVSLMAAFRQSHSAKENLREEGIRYYRMADYDSAAECFTLALKQNEWNKKAYDVDIYYYLADGKLKQEQYSSALAYYEKLLEMGEKSATLYSDMAYCYEQTDNAKVAYKMLKKAVRLEPDNIAIYYNLCQVAASLGKEEDCEQYAKAGQKRMTEKTSVRICALLSFYSRDYEAAYAYYEQLKDSETSAIVYMGVCKAQTGAYEEALALLQNAIEIDGDNALAKAKLAYCYMQMKDYETALPLITEALESKNQTCKRELLMEQGIAYEQLRDFEKAYQCFSEYVRQYPEDEKGVREYDFLSTRVK